MILENLSLPKGLNLHILKPILPAEELEFMIKERAGMSRKDRRIVFPSQKCIRKCLIYYLVEKQNGDFKKVMDSLKDKDENLYLKGLHLTNIKRMYFQRKKEILKENLGE